MRFDPVVVLRWAGRHAILTWGLVMYGIAVWSLLIAGEITSEIVFFSFAPFAFVYDVALLVGFTDEFLSQSRMGLLFLFTLALGCYVPIDYGVLRGFAAYKAAIRKARGQDGHRSSADVATIVGGNLPQAEGIEAVRLSVSERVLIWISRHPLLVWALSVCPIASPLILLKVTYDAGGLWALLYYLGGFICIPFFALMEIVDSLGIDAEAPVPFLITLLGFFALCVAIDLWLARRRLAREKAITEQDTSR